MTSSSFGTRGLGGPFSVGQAYSAKVTRPSPLVLGHAYSAKVTNSSFRPGCLGGPFSVGQADSAKFTRPSPLVLGHAHSAKVTRPGTSSFGHDTRTRSLVHSARLIRTAIRIRPAHSDSPSDSARPFGQPFRLGHRTRTRPVHSDASYSSLSPS